MRTSSGYRRGPALVGLLLLALASLSLPAARADFVPAPQAALSGYRFPWPSGASWWLTTSRPEVWHAVNSSGTTAAIDFFALGVAGANRHVLAAAGGTVVKICTGARTRDVYIKDGNQVTIGYAHLMIGSTDPAVVLGAMVPQGQTLGEPLAGTFTDQLSCVDTRNARSSYPANADQNPSNAHVHLILPTNQTLVMDGWTIAYPTKGLVKGGVLYGPGKYFLSTNVIYVKANVAPNTPSPQSPPANGTLTSRGVTMAWLDTGDPDGGPRGERYFYAELHQVAQGAEPLVAARPWSNSTSWSVTVPADGLYYWQVKAGDGGADHGESPLSAKSFFTVTTSQSCPRKHEGDADCNGSITLFDFELWRRAFTGTPTLDADFSGDGRVSLQDFEIWRRSFTSASKLAVSTDVLTGTQQEVRQPSLFLGDSAYYIGKSDRLEVDVLVEGDPQSLMSGFDIDLQYDAAKLEYQPQADSYASPGCLAHNGGGAYAFASRLVNADDPAGGHVRVSRVVALNGAPVSTELVCVGTIVFTLKPGVFVPLTTEISLSANPASSEVAGPLALAAAEPDVVRGHATVTIDPVARPSELRVEASTAAGLELAWRDNAADETGYYVYRWDPPSRNWIRIGILAAGTTSFLDTTVTCGVSYTYFVTSFNATDESNASEWLDTDGCPLTEVGAETYRAHLPLVVAPPSS